MKRILLLLALTLYFLVNTGKSQISLIGAATNPNSPGISIITWNALDSSSVQTYPTELTGYYLASSVFDAYNGNYYLSGITETSDGLLSFNTKTLEQDLADYTNFSNISEIDMSTGKIYNLTADSMAYFSVNEYDIETGQDSLLGVIDETGTNGIIVDAIAFNSNDGILYYLGYDSIPNLCLYGIPVREEEFSYSKVIIESENPFGNNFFSLNYDNVNNTLFALNSVYDPTGNFTGTNFAEIDPLTGEVTVRSLLDEFMGFVVGSAAFDQNTGSYMVIAIDTNYAWQMMVYDTYTDTYVTGWAPFEASEIVCDNTAFATETYITTLVMEKENSQITLYPNPASEKVTISNLSPATEEVIVSISDITGKYMSGQSFFGEKQVIVDVSQLIPGMYLIRINTGEEVTTQKLLIR